MKPLRFLGTSREDLAVFPESARGRAGHELFMVQIGRAPEDFKPMPTVGPGVLEIRIADQQGAFRILYVARFEEAVFVLHAFQKKTRKTRQADLDLTARRYRMLVGGRS